MVKRTHPTKFKAAKAAARFFMAQSLILWDD